MSICVTKGVWYFPSFPSVKSTLKDEVVERVVFLKEVTQSDLRRKFICFAQNSIGNTTQSIQLKERKGGEPEGGCRRHATAFTWEERNFPKEVATVMIATNML